MQVTFSRFDAQCMAEALTLARRGQYTARPNPCVGALIVKDGLVIGSGFHRAAGEPHAEIHALREAGEAARGATLYVTLEPCCHSGRTPPCSDAVIEAGLARVVIAALDPNPLVAGGGVQALCDAGMTVESGLLEADARKLNQGFERRMRIGRPLVRLKMAMSLDARTAMASGESQWITGPEARRDVQRLRARSSAIITGVGTVIADNPALTVRPGSFAAGELDVESQALMESRQPLRVVVDSGLRTPPDAKLLSGPGPAWLVHGAAGEQAIETFLQAAPKGVTLHAHSGSGGRVDLNALLVELGQAGCNEVLVEAGAMLAGAMIGAGLVDELVLYMAPSLLGHDARAGFYLPGMEVLADRLDLNLTDLRMLGRDIRITANLDSSVGPGAG